MQDKINRLLEILEQYEMISPVNKEEQPKRKKFISPVIILAKGQSYKFFLDARYLNSLTDESKCNWVIEPVYLTLTKINGKYFTTADMNSANNQMPLDEQSRRLTHIVTGNQQYGFNRFFYGISIGPAAFSAFMNKIFRPLKLTKMQSHIWTMFLCNHKKRPDVHCLRKKSSNITTRKHESSPR